MAAATATNNTAHRKRKAQEADIVTPPANDSKRVKLCDQSSDSNVDSVRSNLSCTNTNTNTHASISNGFDCNSEDGFQSFAESNHNTGFAALLDTAKVAPANANGSKENSLSSMSIKSASNEKRNASPLTSTHNRASSNVKSPSQNIATAVNADAVADEALGAFDAFINDTKTNHNSSSSNNSNSNGNHNNHNSNSQTEVEFSWGNRQSSEFKFDSKASEFSFSELASQPSPPTVAKITSSVSGDEEHAVAHLHGMVEAGDQHDETLFQIRCKIWQFSATDQQWHEKGVGVVKVNSYSMPKNGKKQRGARLLCRTEVTLKTLINAVIKKDTEFSKLNGDRVKFTVFEQDNAQGETETEEVDDADDATKMLVVTKTYLLRSKEADKTKMDAFLDKLEQIQDEIEL